jgi:hypothetical protein
LKVNSDPVHPKQLSFRPKVALDEETHQVVVVKTLKLRRRNVARELNILGAHELPDGLDQAVSQKEPILVERGIKNVPNADFDVCLFQARPVQATQQVRQVCVSGEIAQLPNTLFNINVR